MADFIVNPNWEMPARLLPTDAQLADVFNGTYQKVVDCLGLLKEQVEQLAAASSSLAASIAVANSNLPAARSRVNAAGTAGNAAIGVANSNLTATNAQRDRETAIVAATATNTTKLTTASDIATATTAGGQPYSANLQAIANATRANPGILVVAANSTWQWLLAPAGSSFVLEMQGAAHAETVVATNGGAVTAGANNRPINLALYGNMRQPPFGIVEDIVKESPDNFLLLSGPNRRYYFTGWATASNTDAARSRFNAGGTAGRAGVSTQMVLDSNTTLVRHFNLDLWADIVVNVPTETAIELRYQSIHAAANPAIPSAGLGVAGNVSTNVNCYLALVGWRLRYL